MNSKQVMDKLEQLLLEQRLLKEDFEELTDSEKKRLEEVEQTIQEIEAYYEA